MIYSVLLLSRYERKGPSSRVRHYNYIPALERAGFRVTIAPFLDDEYLDGLYHGTPRSPRVLLKGYWRRLLQIATARQYDLIWIEKEALPWLPAFWERVLLDDRPCVIDFDDPWHLRYATHWNGIVRAILGRKLEAMARYANVVTAGSPALAAWARLSQASHVVEMPPTVDTGAIRSCRQPTGLSSLVGSARQGTINTLPLLLKPCSNFTERAERVFE